MRRAIEAARAAIDDGFGRVGFDEIVAFTIPANRRPWRVMEWLGMARDPNDGSISRSSPTDTRCGRISFIGYAERLNDLAGLAPEALFTEICKSDL
jgi:hypothetical protein